MHYHINSIDVVGAFVSRRTTVYVAAGLTPTCSQPAYPIAGIAGALDLGLQSHLALLHPPLIRLMMRMGRTTTRKKEREAQLFNTSTPKRRFSARAADLPFPSIDGRFTNGGSRRRLGRKQRTAKDVMVLCPQDPTVRACLRDGIEKRATVAVGRSTAECSCVHVAIWRCVRP